MKRCVRSLLKEFQINSSKMSEFLDKCDIYESLKFQKLEEVEYPYLELKKYYLCKTFASELATTLENNKFAKSAFATATPVRETVSVTPSDGHLNFTNIFSAAASSSSSSANSTTTQKATSPMSSRYSNLSLNTSLHHELVETFFHQVLRRLIKDGSFGRYIASEQLI